MTTQDSARQEIIEQLGNTVKKNTNSGISHKLSHTMKRWELELVANWIIEDRRRIVEPLVRVTELDNNDCFLLKSDFWLAIDQTLKNAGVD